MGWVREKREIESSAPFFHASYEACHVHSMNPASGERGRIDAFGDEGGEGGLDAGFVFAVGDAEPAVGRGEDTHAGGVGLDERVHGGGEVELGFEFLAVSRDEGLPSGVELREKGGREAPAIHRDGRRGMVGEAGADGGCFDAGVLDDVAQVSVGIDGAYATGDGAVFGQGVAEREADHGVGGHARGGGRGGGTEKVGELVEAIGAVEVVGVKHGERSGELRASAPESVAGAPRFYALDGGMVAGGEGVERLEGVVDGEGAGVARADGGAKLGLEVAADDKEHAVKSGPAGVVDGVIEHGLARGADGIDLFEAAVAGAHAGGEDDESEGHRVKVKKERGGGDLRDVGKGLASKEEGWTKKAFTRARVSLGLAVLGSGPDGGIGRRARLKILLPYGSVGSIPTLGTKARGRCRWWGSSSWQTCRNESRIRIF